MNSVEAGADIIEIEVNENLADDLLSIRVKDNGRGMDEEFVKKVTSPFITSRKTRGVGLGLSLLKASCERCGGELVIKSEPGKGTSIYGTFIYSHIDRPPLGRMADTVTGLIISNISIDFAYRHIFNGQEFSVDTRELKNVLQEIPLNSPEVVGWLKDYVVEGLSNISGGVVK